MTKSNGNEVCSDDEHRVSNHMNMTWLLHAKKTYVNYLLFIYTYQHFTFNTQMFWMQSKGGVDKYK